MNTLVSNSVALCVATLVLSACGGSGGGVRTAPPPASPPPTVPPPPSPGPDFNPCPAPVTADCVVTLQPGEHRDMVPIRSDHALILRGAGSLLVAGEGNRFSGGTHVEGGTLTLSTLESDVVVDAPGRLNLGWLDGDIDNRGTVDLPYGTITGDVHSSGRFGTTGAGYSPPARIVGNLTLAPAGTFAFTLAPAGWDSMWDGSATTALQVDGRAVLAGTLEIGWDDGGSWGPYPLPAPGAHHLIHAGGGIEGEFENLTSPGFAIAGAVRYGTNDLWFDLTRFSLQAAALANGIRRPVSLGSAVNLDRALAGADGFATLPPGSLDEGQRRFLGSTASVLWLQDPSQAERSLDSLAGHAHAAATDALRRHGADSAARVDARLARRDYAEGPLQWSGPYTLQAAGHGVSGLSTGFDQWLSPRLLVGATASSGQASLSVQHLGGRARGESPSAAFHAHYRGQAWHATGVAGAGRTRLQMQRPIELGLAGQHIAHSQRAFASSFLHVEVGRDYALRAARLAPFVAFDYSLVRGDAFTEHGGTGLELTADAHVQAHLSATAGARYSHGWQAGTHAVRFEVDARYRHDLVDADPLQAAFRGVPEVQFELPGQRGTAGAELRLGVTGTIGRDTAWTVDFTRATDARDHAGWTLGLQKSF